MKKLSTQGEAENQTTVIGSFFRIASGSPKIHICNSENDQPVCGRKLDFAKKHFEIKFENGDLKELWGDGKIQEIKWVKVDEYQYCKRCLATLSQNCL